MAAATLIGVSAISGVPVFVRHVGAGKAPPYALVASLNGVHVFGEAQGVTLWTSTTQTSTIVWKTYHNRYIMAQADVWTQGRVLIAGDSRVRRLQDVPDPTYSNNVDFYFRGGILIDNRISLVDENLTSDHCVIILVGFIGDEVMKYTHQVDDDEEITLIRSRESDSSSSIIDSVALAHARWMGAKVGRTVLWTLLYYVNYAAYNSAKVGEYSAGDTMEVSWDSAMRFVQYITRLRLQWVTSIPSVPFYPLNQVLFNGKNFSKMFKTFGAASGEHFRFPYDLLSDGLHPNSKLAKLMWFGLHQAVNRVSNRSPETFFNKDNSMKSGPSTSSQKGDNGSVKSSKHSGQKIKKSGQGSNFRKIPFYSKVRKQASSVHQRLDDQRLNNTFDDDTDELGGGSFGNLSWTAPNTNLSKPSTSKKAPFGTVKKSDSTTPWSWEYHHRVVRETHSKCYTQGIKEQALAESRLSSMIREHGLRAAGQGLVDSFNQARLKWSSNAMEKINAPDKKIRLIQPDLTNLLTDKEEDEEEDDDEEEEEDS